jgi:hypothetical protein
MVNGVQGKDKAILQEICLLTFSVIKTSVESRQSNPSQRDRTQIIIVSYQHEKGGRPLTQGQSDGGVLTGRLRFVGSRAKYDKL